MSLELRFQSFVHSLEQGRIAVWIKRIVFVAIVISLGTYYLFIKFSGFNNPDAMDQAQIGRQLASHQGYSTLYARPFAMNRMLLRKGHVASPLPEISQPPLNPFINAIIFKITRVGFDIPPASGVSNPEKLIVTAGFLFFIGSLILTYFLARRLFTPFLATLACILAFLSYVMWLFAFSGLPQMPMLFFMTAGMLSLAVAMDAQDTKRRLKTLILLTLAAFFMGIAALGNGIGIFIFAGFWLFSTIVIRPRLIVAPLTALAGALPLLPWVFLNWRAYRFPLNLSFYELFRSAGFDKIELLMDLEPLIKFRPWDFIQNVSTNILTQISDFFSYFGGNFVAIAFLLSLIFGNFLRWQAAQFRWCVFFMWIGAIVGMSIFGVDAVISNDQLHTIFLPIMAVYGLDFILTLWSRLDLDQPIFRNTFLILLFLVIAAPFLSSLKGLTRNNPAWPPYLPPLLTRFTSWIDPDEAMAADIPWATAWYANRTSLLLPLDIEQFELIHRERLLDRPLVAIYLSPFSSDRAVFPEIIQGRYRNWARFVLHNIGQDDLRHWMLRYAIPLPMNNQSVLFTDSPRWMRKIEEPQEN